MVIHFLLTSVEGSLADFYLHVTKLLNESERTRLCDERMFAYQTHVSDQISSLFQDLNEIMNFITLGLFKFEDLVAIQNVWTSVFSPQCTKT